MAWLAGGYNRQSWDSDDGCHGITGAHTLGHDAASCAGTCAAGRPSPLFNAPGRRPCRDAGLT